MLAERSVNFGENPIATQDSKDDDTGIKITENTIVNEDYNSQ